MRLTVKNLLAGQTYNLQFRSKNATEVSEWSRTYNVTIGTEVPLPLAPEGVSLESIGDSFHAKWNRVTLSEDGSPATDLIGYVVQFRNVNTLQTATFETTGTDFELTFNLNTAAFTPIAGRIGVRVAAKNSMARQGAWSEEAIAQNPPPGPVRDLTAVGAIGLVNAEWLPPENLEDDFKEYRAYVGTEPDFEMLAARRFWVGVGTAAAWHSEDDSQDYYIKVVAVDKFENESLPQAAGPVRPRSSTKVDVDAPDTPADLGGTIDGNEAVVTWTPPSNTDNDLAGYQIGYRPAGSSNWLYATASHEDSSVAIAPIIRFVSYDFRIRAHDFSFNYSDWSAIVTVPGEVNLPPATPTDFNISGGMRNAMMSWTPPEDSDLSHYEVQFSRESITDEITGVLAPIYGSVHSVHNLEVGTYYARVRAVDLLGLKSEWSGIKSDSVGEFAVPPSDGEAPSHSPVPTASSGINVIFAQWGEVENNDSVTYDVHVDTTESFVAGVFNKVGQTPATFTSVNALANGAPLAHDTDYFIKIVARDVDGAAPASEASDAVRVVKVDIEDIGFDPDELGLPRVTTGPEAPENPRLNDFWYDTSSGATVAKYWDGTVWKNLGLASEQDVDGILGIIDEWTFTGTTEIDGGAIRADTVSAVQMAAGTITAESAIIANAAIGSAQIADLAVTTAKIADASILTAKIGDAQITNAKIANLAVTTAKIGDAQITAAKIGDAQITNAKIANLAVDEAKIANLSVTSAKIQDLAVTNAKIGDLAVDTAKIANLAVTDAKIANLSVDKLIAGDGLITDLTVKSKLTMGDDLNQGVIESFNYTGGFGGAGGEASPAGYRLDNSGITVHSGLISAAALNIQVGPNIMPAALADFELPDSYYSDSSLTLTACTASIVQSGRFNKQSLAVRGTSGFPLTATLAGSLTDYNIPVEEGKVYIVSVYVRGANVTSGFQMRVRFSDGSYSAYTSNTSIPPSAPWTRISMAVAVPAGVTGMLLQLYAIGAINNGWDIDGIQVEEKTGALDTPSAWSPPGMTTIDGGMVRTGEIRSNSMITVNGVQQPAWSINTHGGMQIGSAVIRGMLTVGGTTSESQSIIQSANYLAGSQGFMLRGSDGYADLQNVNINMIGTASKLIAGTSPAGERTEISNVGLRYYGDDVDYTDPVSEFGHDMRIIDVTSDESTGLRGSVWGIDNQGALTASRASISEDPDISGTSLLGTLALRPDEVTRFTELGHLDYLSFAGNVASWTLQESGFPWNTTGEKEIGEVQREQQAGRSVLIVLSATIRSQSANMSAFRMRIRKTQVDLPTSVPPPRPTTSSSQFIGGQSGEIIVHGSGYTPVTRLIGLHIPGRSEVARWMPTIERLDGTAPFSVTNMTLAFLDMGPRDEVSLDPASRIQPDGNPPPPAVTPKKRYTSRWYANSIRRAQGSSVTATNDRPGQALQGWTSGMSGDPFHTIAGFTGTAHHGEVGRTITQVLSGVSNSDIERVRIRTSHAAGYSGVPPRLGIQSSSTAIPTINQTVSNTSPGQTRYHTMSDTFRNNLNSGQRYITFGPYLRANKSYASYHGTSGGNSRRLELEITYRR